MFSLRLNKRPKNEHSTSSDAATIAATSIIAAPGAPADATLTPEGGAIKQPPVGLVERERELERLYKYWHTAIEGHGKVVLLSGEAGQGKSTLADEFLRSIDADGLPHKTARAACSAQSGRDEPFWPFAEVIGQLAASDTRKITSDILDTVLDLAPAWAMMIPVAGGVVGASIKTAQAVRNRTRTSNLPNPDKLLHEYVGALRKVADKQPVLIFIDDLHWSDPGSIKLLSLLSRNILTMRVLVVVAYRPSDIAVEGHPLHELIAELLRYDTETEIALPSLSLEGAAALLTRIYPANKFPSSLPSALYKNTGGSPFFIVESLRLMQSREQITRDEKDGKWMLVREINEEDLPRSVEAVIRKRLERMPKDLLEILSQAAVQGLTFETAVLAHVLDRDELAVMKLLEPAEKVHSVIEYIGDIELPNDITSRYRFASSLIQRELVDALRGKQLLMAHRKTAEGLEKVWGADNQDLAPKLGVHYEKGRVWDKAAHYNILAGKQARSASAIPQAIALFETAERFAAKTPQTPSDVQFEIDDNLSYLYEVDSAYDKSRMRLEHALAAGSEALGWRKYAELKMRAAKLADDQGEFTESLSLLQQLHNVLDANQAEQDSYEAYDLHAQLCAALTRLDRPAEGIAFARDGLEGLAHLTRTAETHHIYIRLNTALALAEEAQGNYAQVAELLERICATARQLRDTEILPEALVNLAEVYLVLGKYEQSQEYVKELFEYAEQISSESALVDGLMVKGRALFYLEKYSDALISLTEAARLMQISRYFAVREKILVLRAATLGELGSTSEAASLFEQARAVAQISGSREMIAYVEAIQGLLELTLGKADKALTFATNSLQVFSSTGDKFEQALCWRLCGRACRALSQADMAQHAFQQARAIFESIGNGHQVAVTDRYAQEEAASPI